MMQLWRYLLKEDPLDPGYRALRCFRETSWWMVRERAPARREMVFFAVEWWV